MLARMNEPPSAPTLPASDPPAFAWRERKNGEVEVLHHGRLASLLRGAAAREFMVKAAAGTTGDVQQFMARITGNYRRGNERVAAAHPRNRR